MGTGIALVDDLSGLGVKDIFGLAATWNQSRIDAGIAKTKNQIAEWEAQYKLLALQNQSAGGGGSSAANGSGNSPLLLVGGLLLLAGIGYWLLKD